MTVIATAKRRRQQAKKGYRHLPPLTRPRYRMAARAELAVSILRLATSRKQKKG